MGERLLPGLDIFISEWWLVVWLGASGVWNKLSEQVELESESGTLKLMQEGYYVRKGALEQIPGLYPTGTWEKLW